jgi:hypothetical protein
LWESETIVELRGESSAKLRKRRIAMLTSKILALLLSVVVADSVFGQEPADSGIGYPTVSAALQDLKTKPNAQIRAEDGWTVVEERNDTEMILWSFTPEDHPAHPAAIKRRVYESDGAVYIDMKALCEAEKAPCDALVEQFQAITERIRQQLAGAAQ